MRGPFIIAKVIILFIKAGGTGREGKCELQLDRFLLLPFLARLLRMAILLYNIRWDQNNMWLWNRKVVYFPIL